MQARSVRDAVFWVGALNPNLRVFDIVLNTPHGTTYNSYLVDGEKSAVIETVYRKFAPSFLERVESVKLLEEIDYLVVNHTEMDHSTAVGAFLERAPQTTVVATAAGTKFLKQILNRDFNSLVVKDGDTLDLGGKQLRFITVPFWHWPDTMFTYLEEDKILFTCDGFGTHFCDERLFNDLVDDFSADFKLYYDVIMRPFRKKIAEGLEKIKDLEIEMIAPSHGPILRDHPERYIESYKEWSKPPATAKTVVVFYDSIYGDTRMMAEEISKGARSSRLSVKMLEASKTDLDVAKNEVEKAAGILFGSPTVNNDAVKPIWDIISTFFDIETRGKAAGAFGSYGWSGEAVRLIEERLKGLHIQIPFEGIRVNFTPNETDLKSCFEFGKNFGEFLNADN